MPRRAYAGDAAGVSTATKAAKKRKSTTASVVELVLIIAVALGLALAIQAWIVKPYRIPSGSMEPTLSIGQRVLVNRIGKHFSKPHVGEIAVFHPPEGRPAGGVRARTPHVIKPGGAACAEPVPEEGRASTSSSASSPARAT